MDKAIKNSRSKNDLLLNKLRRVISSAVIFFTVSVLAIIILQYINAMLIGSYDKGVIFSFNKMLNFSTDYRDWSRISVTIIFSIAPLVLFIAGILAYLKFHNDKHEGDLSLFSLAALWSSIVFINIFLTLLFVGFSGKLSYNWSLYQNFAVVFAWWRFHEILLVPISIISLVASLLFGFFIGNDFLEFSYSNRLVYKTKGRSRFLVQIFLFPILIGSIGILTLSTQYSLLLHSFFFLNLLLISVGVFIRTTSSIYGKYQKRKDLLNKNISLWHLISVILWPLVFLFFR